MILPTITNKQKEILLLLYRFRFLNRIQIQKLLKHKDYKNINAWLKDLTDKNYTKRIFEKKAGINEPAIYFISKNGIKFLHFTEGVEKEYIKKLNQEMRRSRAFINQCILIADNYLLLEGQNLKSFKFYTQTDFPLKGLIRDLLPSFAYVHEQDNSIKQNTCEIIKDGMPRYAIRRRIQEYIDFFKDQKQVDIVFFCQTEKLKQYIEKYIARTLEENDIEIKMATVLF